jgi:ribonuclease P protein subunit POP4
MSPVTPRNILRHELIGLNVTVRRANSRTIRGVRGVIVDETRNTLTVNGRRGQVMIPKNIATFRFDLPNGVRVDVDGERLVAKPENRLKTKVKRW